MGPPEKREHRRVQVQLSARLQAEDGRRLEATVENLGALGALLSTADLEVPLGVGDRVSLEIEGPGGKRVPASGEILRMEQEFAAGEIRRAFAIRFDKSVDLGAA